MLDLNDIAMFVQVVRHGSFAGAARRLGLPPNTVSPRIHWYVSTSCSATPRPT